MTTDNMPKTAAALAAYDAHQLKIWGIEMGNLIDWQIDDEILAARIRGAFKEEGPDSALSIDIRPWTTTGKWLRWIAAGSAKVDAKTTDPTAPIFSPADSSEPPRHRYCEAVSALWSESLTEEKAAADASRPRVYLLGDGWDENGDPRPLIRAIKIEERGRFASMERLDDGQEFLAPLHALSDDTQAHLARNSHP